MTVIHGYADAKDPALQIRMHFPRGPSGSPVTLIGPMPEQFNYSISAQWEALAGRGEMPDGSAEIEERRVGKECRSRWSPYH